MPWSDERLAYMAGIIDGEGTISIFRSFNSSKGKRYPCYCARLNVYNSDERLMLWLKDNFGGSFRIVKRKEERDTSRWKPAYIWEIGRLAAVDVIKAVLPYLVIKQAQANLFLEFRKTVEASSQNVYGVSGLPANVIAIREEIMEQIHQLNRKGLSDAVASA